MAAVAAASAHMQQYLRSRHTRESNRRTHRVGVVCLGVEGGAPQRNPNKTPKTRRETCGRGKREQFSAASGVVGTGACGAGAGQPRWLIGSCGRHVSALTASITHRKSPEAASPLHTASICLLNGDSSICQRLLDRPINHTHGAGKTALSTLLVLIHPGILSTSEHISHHSGVYREAATQVRARLIHSGRNGERGKAAAILAGVAPSWQQSTSALRAVGCAHLTLELRS